MIHCTATPSHLQVKPAHINKWHLEERGWSRVGYSMLVERTGKLDILIPFDNDDVIESWEISNGARGWNGRTKHIAWAGGINSAGNAEDNRTGEQKRVLEAVVKLLVTMYPDICVIGHNQVSEKFCPSFDVPYWAQNEAEIHTDNIDYGTYR